jgi:MYXO-CTERM domain-containing protein
MDTHVRRLTFVTLAAAGSLVAASAHAKTVSVSTEAELEAAIAAAAAGDEIVLADGTYASTGITCSASGTASAPIFVHAATPLGAKINFDALEGFHVTSPYWRFEGLDIHGVCADDSNCEHAFHVTGNAAGFVMRKNRVVDFNAQLKVNADTVGAGGSYVMPNGGLVEGNEVFDTHPRATSNPVTKLNIDTVDDWIVRANYVHDGHKNGGDFVSYQSFIKGGGKNGLYERNLVICTKDDTTGGTRIGLSFGGGGTAPQFCAPAFDASVPCSIEMTGGTMRNNIIVDCSDVGIYLNEAKDSHILYNTMIATSGVDFRFASTSGEADGNILDSNIRTRDGGAMTLLNNLTGLTTADFTGFYVDPLNGDLRKKGDLSSLLGKGTARTDVPDDYCARVRSGAYDLGALQSSLGDCDTTFPPLGGATSSDGGATDGGKDATSSDATSDGAIADSNPPDTRDFDNALNENPSTGCGCETAGGDDRVARGWIVGLAAFAIVASRRRRRAITSS